METFNTISNKIYSREGNIVRDSYGVLHCVYQGQIGSYDEPKIYYIKSEDNGVTWINEEQISNNDASAQTNPSLVIDNNDNLYVTWGGIPLDGTINNISFRKLVNNTWSDIEVITNVPYRQYSAISCVLAIDGNNIVHIVYTYSPLSNDSKEQLYYNSYNGSWGSEISLTTDISYRNFTPNLCIGSDNSLHLAWIRTDYMGNDGMAQYRKKTHEGTWGSTTTFGGANNISIAIDNSQRIILMKFHAGSRSLVSRIYTTSWSNEQIVPIPYADLVSMPSIDIVCSNNIYAIFSLGLNIAPIKIYSTTFTTTWSTITEISTAWYSSFSQSGPIKSINSYWPRIDNKSYNRPMSGKSAYIKLWMNGYFGAPIYYENDVVYPTIDRPPTINISQITDINTYSARLYGNLTYSGSDPISRMGFCLVKSEVDDPTIDDIIVDKDSPFTLGEFNLLVSGFLSNTTYKIRAFAINSIGVAYSNTVTITTNSIKGLLIKF